MRAKEIGAGSLYGFGDFFAQGVAMHECEHGSADFKIGQGRGGTKSKRAGAGLVAPASLVCLPLRPSARSVGFKP